MTHDTGCPWSGEAHSSTLQGRHHLPTVFKLVEKRLTIRLLKRQVGAYVRLPSTRNGVAMANSHT